MKNMLLVIQHVRHNSQSLMAIVNVGYGGEL